MARQHNLRSEFLSAEHCGGKILYFKPQQHTIPMSKVWVADGPVMMFRLPAMQLHEQLTVRKQLLILFSAVAALASQQTLVPATARFDISDANQGLWTHLLSNSSTMLLRQGPRCGVSNLNEIGLIRLACTCAGLPLRSAPCGVVCVSSRISPVLSRQLPTSFPMPETEPLAPPATPVEPEPAPHPSTLPPAQPQTEPDPFEPDWPETRPLPPPKARECHVG